ncbi:MAG: hypothetical protein AVDCRST_MAG12-1601, partial [uncultured Rubrobacteraceae bacterium]
ASRRTDGNDNARRRPPGETAEDRGRAQRLRPGAQGGGQEP